jgi:hypothetical protein
MSFLTVLALLLIVAVKREPRAAHLDSALRYVATGVFRSGDVIAAPGLNWASLTVAVLGEAG